MTDNTERQLIELIATDRISIPVKSMGGKLDRQKPRLAKAINLENGVYAGDRVYARVETDETMKARGMREAIDLFAEQYPEEAEEEIWRRVAFHWNQGLYQEYDPENTEYLALYDYYVEYYQNE